MTTIKSILIKLLQIIIRLNDQCSQSPIDHKLHLNENYYLINCLKIPKRSIGVIIIVIIVVVVVVVCTNIYPYPVVTQPHTKSGFQIKNKYVSNVDNDLAKNSLI